MKKKKTKKIETQKLFITLKLIAKMGKTFVSLHGQPGLTLLTIFGSLVMSEIKTKNPMKAVNYNSWSENMTFDLFLSLNK